jgi:hypothetical protein
MLSSAAVPFAAAASEADALKDARAVQTAERKETGRPAYSPGHGVNFKPSDPVFVKSALTVDFTYRNASVTLPLFRGDFDPQGRLGGFGNQLTHGCVAHGIAVHLLS